MSRKKSIENEPLPFTELKRFTKTYPNVWSTCDMFHNDNGKNGLPPWNKLCEVQISATLSIMTKYPRATIDKMFPAECAALYAWRKHKIIYKFDKDLAKMLNGASGRFRSSFRRALFLAVPLYIHRVGRKRRLFGVGLRTIIIHTLWNCVC